MEEHAELRRLKRACCRSVRQKSAEKASQAKQTEEPTRRELRAELDKQSEETRPKTG